jgi:hypothetical protein
MKNINKSYRHIEISDEETAKLGEIISKLEKLTSLNLDL